MGIVNEHIFIFFEVKKESLCTRITKDKKKGEEGSESEETRRKEEMKNGGGWTQQNINNEIDGNTRGME